MTTSIPRPKRTDPAIVKIVAAALAPDVKVWLGDDTSLADIQDDLEHAIKWGDTDGYEIAKRLDRDFSYSPDEALVDVLSAAYGHQSSALSSAEKEWVKEVGIEPPVVGAKVICTVRPPIPGVGEVIGVDPDGKARVHYPSQSAGSAYVLEWERLEVAP